MANIWEWLSQYTDARVGIPRHGVSQSTEAQLKFQLDHAKARDAVWAELDFVWLAEQLPMDSIAIQSQAQSRSQYLTRPDLGRKLNSDSSNRVAGLEKTQVAIVIADGLSTTAISAGITELFSELKKLESISYKSQKLFLAEQARVALGDEIGELLEAELCIMIIGERPGLSASDSIGIYLTYEPRIGKSDANRNCISNIRPGGLTPKEACFKMNYLINEFYHRGLSGVTIKDLSDEILISDDGVSKLENKD